MEHQANGRANTVDLAIIGGGINGCSIAADAARRGLSVMLCEQNDLASGTSSYSSKLIHGGLRYLEQKDFRLVKHALAEREIWLQRAPHLIKPMAFVLPHENHLRPKWMLRIGLWLYDHLAKRKTIPASRYFKRQQNELLSALVVRIQYGFSYYDCFCDDARLVVSLAQQAKQYGAHIYTRHACTHVELNSQKTHWQVTLLDKHNQRNQHFNARAVINAAGPWMAHVSQHIIEPYQPHNLTLIKGSHIIVPRLYEGNHAYILQNVDQRIVFAIPYLSKYTLIGTTDEAFHGDLNAVHINQEEIDYLCVLINHYFKKAISPSDIVSSYSGVRPLLQEDGKKPSEVSRDYQILFDARYDNAPLVTIAGGKLTTARLLAKDTLDKLQSTFSYMKPCQTATQPLPGGNLSAPNLQQFIQQQQLHYKHLPAELIARYCRLYGSQITELLKGRQSIEELGRCFGADLYQCEVDYLRRHEWAQTAEDILWRRTKLGLFLDKDQQQQLQHILETT